MQDEVCAYKYAVDTDVIDRTELRKIQYFEMSKEEQSKYKKHNWVSIQENKIALMSENTV